MSIINWIYLSVSLAVLLGIIFCLYIFLYKKNHIRKKKQSYFFLGTLLVGASLWIIFSIYLYIELKQQLIIPQTVEDIYRLKLAIIWF